MIPRTVKKKLDPRAKADFDLESRRIYLKTLWARFRGSRNFMRCKTLAHLHHAPRPMARAIGTPGYTPQPFFPTVNQPKGKPYDYPDFVYAAPRPACGKTRNNLKTRKHYAAAICMRRRFRGEKIQFAQGVFRRTGQQPRKLDHQRLSEDQDAGDP